VSVYMLREEPSPTRYTHIISTTPPSTPPHPTPVSQVSRSERLNKKAASHCRRATLGNKVSRHTRPCADVFTYLLTYINITYTQRYVNTRTYMYMHRHMYIYTHVHAHTHVHTYSCTYIQMYTRTYMYMHIHMYKHTHVCTYTNRYIHTDVHTYIHVHAHTHVYAHTHVHT
jgi:hypothetical protein